MMNVCKESWLLFFEEKIDKFTKGYEMKKPHLDYWKYSEEEGYNAFSNKTFGLRLGSVVKKVSTTKGKSHDRYYLINEGIKNKYRESDDVEIDVMISLIFLKEFEFNL
jgi:hypothetical protein